MNISEETFKSWAKGPGITEQTKCDNAETAVQKAIDAHEKLSSMDITVFPQGSYRNLTNVRHDSDVDICVRLNSTFFADYPQGHAREDFGNGAGSISFHDYRNLVQEALETYFGRQSVKRGNKAFDIHANTYRVDADVVAALENRRYTGRTNADGSHHFLSGIAFNTDANVLIRNWPEQHYDNALSKHKATGNRFRKMIRILKRLRSAMQEEEIKEATDIASCLIEHLVWNVPDDRFGHEAYTDDVRSILAYTFNNTIKDDGCGEWGEVSELLYLFRSGKPWTREQAHGFLSAAWDYIGFK